MTHKANEPHDAKMVWVLHGERHIRRPGSAVGASTASPDPLQPVLASRRLSRVGRRRYQAAVVAESLLERPGRHCPESPTTHWAVDEPGRRFRILEAPIVAAPHTIQFPCKTAPLDIDWTCQIRQLTACPLLIGAGIQPESVDSVCDPVPVRDRLC